MSNVRKAVLQPRKRRMFIHSQGEEKQGIKDESAAYNFQSRLQQAPKLHCTASGSGGKPSTPTCIHLLGVSLDISVCLYVSYVIFVLHSQHTVRGIAEFIV